MSDVNKIKTGEREIIYKQYDRKTLFTFILMLGLCFSLPGNVKCDMGDAISSVILFVLISVFICAGIGWWSRRGESK
jgi:hypothetical protein